MSLISFDRMSPDKVMPAPFANEHIMNRAGSNLNGSIMTLVKIQDVDDNEMISNQNPEDDSMSKINNSALKEARSQQQAVRFSTTKLIASPPLTQLEKNFS